RADDLKAEIESRVPFEYEFNVPGDLEGWLIYNGSGDVNNGYITFTSVFNDKFGIYDPQIYKGGLSVDTDVYDSLTIRLRPDFDESDGSNSQKLSVYFVTTMETSMNELKRVDFDMSTLTPDDEGFITATLDLEAHEKWTGVCTDVRVDTDNRMGTFTIDYVHFNMDPAHAESAQAALNIEKEYLKNLMLVDEGKPFYVKNADAQVASIGAEFSTDASKVSVVDDDLRPGNRAFLITTDRKDIQVWTYLVMPTRFKPGVTYKVDYEVRIVGDINGNPAVDVAICPNFRYTDYKADGSLKDMADHPTGSTKISTSDGWVKLSVTHTVSEKSPQRASDYFTIFSSPIEIDGVPVNYAYMIDNIQVSVVE
ncbi:MAG: hypothetical protein J6K12_06125, partial [Clostridia bacterium]|nr:hypothetical protein [Clostridia bacterium]